MVSDQQLSEYTHRICDAIQVQKDDRVIIWSFDRSPEATEALIKEIQSRQAEAIYYEVNGRVSALIHAQATAESLEAEWQSIEPLLTRANKHIRIKFWEDPTADKIVGADKLKLISKHISQKAHQIVTKCPWVLIWWPKEVDAQNSGIPLEELHQMNIDATLINYELLTQKSQPLLKLMQKTDHVHIQGPDTDLHFSIKGIGAESCMGDLNLPDGEIMSAPVRDSINGHVKFNIPLVQDGVRFQEVYLEFQDGKIVNSKSDDSEKNQRLQDIFDKDEGSRYTGEFALGINPFVTKPTGRVMMDEKINGSFHIAVGRCYDSLSNGNTNSGLHWDMVCIQTPEYGGGEIYFDNVLIRKDGKFVLDELKPIDETDYSI